MSLRKTAGLLAGFGLLIGLVGGGVGAQFTDQVTAAQNISVGTFGCIISDGGGGALAPDQKSVSFSTTILSSAASSAPVHFTVSNTGSIPALLTVTASPAALGAPFTYLPLTPPAGTAVAAGGTLVSAGVQWTELTNANLGQTGTVTYTVVCVDQGIAPIAP